VAIIAFPNCDRKNSDCSPLLLSVAIPIVESGGRLIILASAKFEVTLREELTAGETGN